MNSWTPLIKKLCTEEIFPLLEINNISISFIAIYGSRVAEFARKDSDLDVHVQINLLNNDKEFSIEYHGILEGIRLELNIFTGASLENDLSKGNISRTICMNDAVKIFGDESEFKKFKNMANIRYKNEIENTKETVESCDFNSQINILKWHIQDLQSYLTDKRISGLALPKHIRLSEAILDFSQIALELSLHRKNNISESEFWLLYLLRTRRPGRFFDIEKYNYSSVMNELSSLFNEGITWDGFIEIAEEFCVRNFETSILQPNQNDQVLLYREL
jgi:hypothetical protein